MSGIRRLLTLFAFLGGAAVATAACSGGSATPGELAGGATSFNASQDVCATPHEGCPCTSAGTSAACGRLETRSGDYVTCALGTTTCDPSGTWGACVADHQAFVSTTSATLSGGGVHTEDYGMPTPCLNNPCDPRCMTVPDNGFGVDAGVGLKLTDAGGFTLLPDAPPPDAVVACTGLQCQVNYGCSAGKGPKVTGVVYDPASLNPVFNAIIMFPNGPVSPIAAGVSSDACGGATLPPAVDYAFTGYDGSFTLSNVPIGTNIPVLIQVGRWRRSFTLNTGALGCGQTLNISSNCGGGNLACLTRLPRVQSEGNIPHIAMASASLDAMECLLYRMGVASSEFTDELGAGRVHFFRENGSSLPGGANHDVSYLMGFGCSNGRCAPGSGPVCGNVAGGVTNGAFETGTLSGWSVSGASATVAGGGAHAGSYSALLGKSTATGGDSTISQSFTAPVGATQISFWYKMTCPDTVQYDWAVANLVDNTAGTTNNVLPKTCATGSWTQATASITPGHSYTLSLSSHDDNYPSDPTYTYFDDVSFANCASPSPPPNLLPNYDLVMLPCDGGDEYASGLWGANANEPGRVNLVNYANAGGRIFASHWAREWIERPGATLTSGPFPGVATWYPVAQQPSPSNACATYGCVGNNGSSQTAFFDTGFQRGNDFAAWMGNVAGKSSQLSITNARYDVASVGAASKRFVYAWGDDNPAAHSNTNPDSVMDFTFDTPIGGTPAGRTMFTDMHLASGTPGGSFPNNCPTQGTALSAQEKAAEFLLLDLSGCVSKQPPPQTATWYDGATVSRRYQTTCRPPQKVVWRFFYWTDVIPPVDAGPGAQIQFSVQTANSAAALAAAPVVSLANVTTTNASFVGSDIGQALNALSMKSQDYLQVNVALLPSSDHTTAPTLTAWQLTYDCVDAE